MENDETGRRGRCESTAGMLPAAGTTPDRPGITAGSRSTMAALVSKGSLCHAGIHQAAWRCPLSSSICPRRTLRSSHSQMSVASAAARRTASGSLRSARIHDLT